MHICIAKQRWKKSSEWAKQRQKWFTSQYPPHSEVITSQQDIHFATEEQWMKVPHDKKKTSADFFLSSTLQTRPLTTFHVWGSSIRMVYFFLSTNFILPCPRCVAKLLSPTKVNVTQKIILHWFEANEETVRKKMRSTFIYVAIVRWLGYGCDGEIDLQRKREKNASAFGHFLASFFEPRARKYKTNLTVLA